jgi:UDP-4-amino-4,6-dideoxy-N-acetyl-beta-L-altrosamine transaminase
MIPYSTQSITDLEVQAVTAALLSGWLTQGPAVPRFEARLSELHAVAHAVAVSNATAGLHIACLALGVGPGSRVWTTPNSFAASANCALYCGADVDFVDMNPATRNLSTTALREKLEAARRRDVLPHVVIPVDFSGLSCDYVELRQLADAYGFKILEDASHAVGATYRGLPVGGQLVDAAVFSFHAVKIVTTAEGGMVVTRDPQIAHRLRLLRSHGITRAAEEFSLPAEGAWYYEQKLLGFNYRMTDIQAALGCVQLDRLDELRRRRCELAQSYDVLLRDLPLIRPLVMPDRESSHHLYVVELDATCRKTRAEVFAELRDAGIGVNVHYIPIHLQPFYRARGFAPGDFPASERYYGRALSIPLFPGMSSEQQTTVADTLARILSA